MVVLGPQGDGLFTQLLMWMHSLPLLCDWNSPAVETAFQFLNIIIILLLVHYFTLPRVLLFFFFFFFEGSGI